MLGDPSCLRRGGRRVLRIAGLVVAGVALLGVVRTEGVPTLPHELAPRAWPRGYEQSAQRRALSVAAAITAAAVSEATPAPHAEVTRRLTEEASGDNSNGSESSSGDAPAPLPDGDSASGESEATGDFGSADGGSGDFPPALPAPPSPPPSLPPPPHTPPQPPTPPPGVPPPSAPPLPASPGSVDAIRFKVTKIVGSGRRLQSGSAWTLDELDTLRSAVAAALGIGLDDVTTALEPQNHQQARVIISLLSPTVAAKADELVDTINTEPTFFPTLAGAFPSTVTLALAEPAVMLLVLLAPSAPPPSPSPPPYVAPSPSPLPPFAPGELDCPDAPADANGTRPTRILTNGSLSECPSSDGGRDWVVLLAAGLGGGLGGLIVLCCCALMCLLCIRKRGWERALSNIRRSRKSESPVDSAPVPSRKARRAARREQKRAGATVAPGVPATPEVGYAAAAEGYRGRVDAAGPAATAPEISYSGPPAAVPAAPPAAYDPYGGPPPPVTAPLPAADAYGGAPSAGYGGAPSAGMVAVPTPPGATVAPPPSGYASHYPPVPPPSLPTMPAASSYGGGPAPPGGPLLPPMPATSSYGGGPAQPGGPPPPSLASPRGLPAAPNYAAPPPMPALGAGVGAALPPPMPAGGLGALPPAGGRRALPPPGGGACGMPPELPPLGGIRGGGGLAPLRPPR